MGFFSKILGKKKEEDLSGGPLEAAASEKPSQDVSPDERGAEGFARGEEEPSHLSASEDEATDEPVYVSVSEAGQTNDAAGPAHG